MIGHSIRALGIGLAVMGLSEMAFYPVVLRLALWQMALVYGLISLLTLLIDALGPRRAVPAAILLSGLFGFLVEGVPVPVLYEAPPVSIVWTSLAWHAAISIGVGVALWRAALARGWIAGACMALGLGVLLGVWGGYAWPALAETDAPTSYAVQMVLAAAMLGLGHALAGLARPARAGRAVRVAASTLAALAAGSWTLSWAVPLLPLSLILPVLALLTWAALRRLPAGEGAAAVWLPPVPAGRHVLAALVPLAAIPVQAAMPAGTELNAWWILIVGPPATGLWLWALWRGLRPGADGPAGLARGARGG